MFTRNNSLSRKLEALSMAPFDDLREGCELPESLDRRVDVAPPKPVIKPSLPPVFAPRFSKRIKILPVQFALLSEDF